jgi:hypothetical protein
MSAPRPVLLHGLLAEFDSPAALVAAAEATRRAGYRRTDAFTPFPIEEVAHALGHHHSKVPYLVLTGGILGALGGFGLCYWTSVIAYPMNIGGRPFNSWPSFLPITFECTILLAAFAAVFGMLALNGLPRPYHPVFNVERFVHASRDRYFLCIQADDPQFDRVATRAFLAGLHPSEVSEIED